MAAKTVTSTTTPYCVGSRVSIYYDVRDLGDFLDDTGARVSAANVPTHPNMVAALMAASGDIESACMEGGRYTPADLAALVTAASAGGALLERCCAWLTFWSVMARRIDGVPKNVEAALAFLERLRRGEAVFGFQETIDASGGATTAKLYPDADDVARSPVGQARRLFGERHLTDY